MSDRKINLLIPITIFFFSFFLRLFFFTGFILGDDAQEFALVKHNLYNEPVLSNHYHLRFGVWIFNAISFKLLGISEFSFFLPTFLMSSTLAIIGYYILVLKRYSRKHAFLAGLFIASAPFEILVGTVRANDVILSWFFALALLSLILFEKKPMVQGSLVAFFLWFAFYVKLWAIYLLPVIIIYYIYHYVKKKKWQGGASFFVASATLHGITSIIWKIKTGNFLQFIHVYTITYPVPEGGLVNLFQIYPKIIFEGSEFGTTLFGYVPYLLLLLLSVKIILAFSKRYKNKFRFDRLDIYLIAFYASFLLLLNFFPNTFKFDQYYSVPRIFRYLAPISFPMTLHLAKLIIDFHGIFFKDIKLNKAISYSSYFKKFSLVLIFLFLISVNIYQADEATKPGQIYRRNLLLIVEDVKEQSPKQLLSEFWLGFFMEVYLQEDKIYVAPFVDIHNAKDYEKWLDENQYALPEGTMMISGLGSYLHYGCHVCGFRLAQFNGSLDPRWELFKEYDTLSYLPVPEPARLWVWKPRNDATSDIKTEALNIKSRIDEIIAKIG